MVVFYINTSFIMLDCDSKTACPQAQHDFDLPFWKSVV